MGTANSKQGMSVIYHCLIQGVPISLIIRAIIHFKIYLINRDIIHLPIAFIIRAIIYITLEIDLKYFNNSCNKYSYYFILTLLEYTIASIDF